MTVLNDGLMKMPDSEQLYPYRGILNLKFQLYDKAENDFTLWLKI